MKYDLKELEEILKKAKLSEIEIENAKSSIGQYGIFPRDREIIKKIKWNNGDYPYWELRNWCDKNKVQIDSIQFEEN